MLILALLPIDLRGQKTTSYIHSQGNTTYLYDRDTKYSPPPPFLPSDCLHVICYSLILLSVDLTSPHVKNKMSKREFIRNLRHATVDVSDETFGHMYDNIYLSGHVATDYGAHR